MTLKDRVYGKGIEEIRASGLNGTLEVHERYLPRGNFMACTSLESKGINFTYSPSIEEEKVLEVSGDAIPHEINHHQYKGCIGCPQNVDKDYDLFFVPMYGILSEQGFSSEDVEYIINGLQDSILHRDLRANAGRSLDGIVSFFEDIGRSIEDKKFTDFYEAHVKLNMLLWGTKEQKKRLNKFYSNSEKVKEALDGFLGELNNGSFRTTARTYTRSRTEIRKNPITRREKKVWIDRKEQEVPTIDREGVKSYVLDENNWGEISRLYAKHFSKLVQPSYALPTLNHSGAGTLGRESEDASEQGNPFKKERNSRKFKKGKVMKSHKQGEKAPSWIGNRESLELVYEGLAEQIEIKAEEYTDPKSFPISWYGEREFDEERDSFRHIRFGINEKGEVELRKKRYHLDIPVSVKTSPKGFPQIKFGIVDCSPSMKKDINGGGNIGNASIIPWGDNSKYHWAVLTQLGIFEYFRRNHLLDQNSISSAFFSDETNVVNGYKNVLDSLFNPAFGSSTILDLDKIKTFFEGEGNLVYTIGDGEIQNWRDIREEFIRNAGKHNYVHLHMGTEEGNQTVQDLRKANLEVVVAQNGKGIPQRVIDLTDKIIRGS